MARGNRAVRDFAAYLEGAGRRAPRARRGDPEKDVLTRLIHGEHERRAR